jgi:nucleolar GTP-binding protein
VLVVNKIDTVGLEDLHPDKRSVLARLEEQGITLLGMSTLTEEGVANVKSLVRWARFLPEQAKRALF